MKKSEIIRAWTDEEYRDSLSAEERAQVPEHPAGLLSIDDDVLSSIAGGCQWTTPATSCVPPGYHCP